MPIAERVQGRAPSRVELPPRELDDVLNQYGRRVVDLGAAPVTPWLTLRVSDSGYLSARVGSGLRRYRLVAVVATGDEVEAAPVEIAGYSGSLRLLVPPVAAKNILSRKYCSASGREPPQTNGLPALRGLPSRLRSTARHVCWPSANRLNSLNANALHNCC